MSELLCKKCDSQMLLRDGYDPTPYCDSCAHEMVEELLALIDRANSVGYGTAFTIQIERIQKERDEWKRIAESLKAAQPNVLSLTHKFEKLRRALDLVTLCPTCEGTKIFTPECYACLSGEPDKCTCETEKPETCPECEGTGRLFFGVYEEATAESK